MIFHFFPAIMSIITFVSTSIGSRISIWVFYPILYTYYNVSNSASPQFLLWFLLGVQCSQWRILVDIMIFSFYKIERNWKIAACLWEIVFVWHQDILRTFCSGPTSMLIFSSELSPTIIYFVLCMLMDKPHLLYYS